MILGTTPSAACLPCVPCCAIIHVSRPARFSASVHISEAFCCELIAAQVAAGAAQVYEGELRGVRQLSASGAAQLSADLDYFCNVLAALGVAVPPALLTWQVRVMRARSSAPLLGPMLGPAGRLGCIVHASWRLMLGAADWPGC